MAHPDDLAAERLTAREREVVVLLADGVTSSRDLAERLVVSPHTVHFHMGSILRKTGVRTRAQVIAYAYQHGLLL